MFKRLKVQVFDTICQSHQVLEDLKQRSPASPASPASSRLDAGGQQRQVKLLPLIPPPTNIGSGLPGPLENIGKQCFIIFHYKQLVPSSTSTTVGG